MTSASLDRPEGRAPALLALAALVGVLTAVTGPAGTLAGIAAAAAWYVLGTPYALAAGHVALPALFPAGIDPTAFVLVELAFLALTVAPAVGSARPLEGGVVIASVLVLGGITWLALQNDGITVAAAILVSTVAIAAYAVDRYERVRLGLAAFPSEEPAGEVDE